LNFILNPETILKSFKLFDNIIYLWFKNINIMPVLSTINWKINSLKLLNKFIKEKVNVLKNYNINKYSYFNWISSDKQFILDTDGILYQDLDSLLWIQKQYKSTSINLSRKINEKTKIGKIDELNMYKVLKKYNISNIVKLVFDLPKEQNNIQQYEILKKILN
jgi:hypothetical protein